MVWSQTKSTYLCDLPHRSVEQEKKIYCKGPLFILKAKSKRIQEQQEDGVWGSLYTSNFTLSAFQKVWCSVPPNSWATPWELHTYWIVLVHTVFNAATDGLLPPPWGLNLFISAAHLERSPHLSRFQICIKFIVVESLAESRQCSPVCEIWTFHIWPLIASGCGETR